MATVDQFVTQWLGKSPDYDGWYGSQCVDLFNFYNRDVVGCPWLGTPLTGGAQDLWEAGNANRDKHYVKVSKSTTPQKGDVAVWDGTLPGSGGYGHVAIVMRPINNSVFASLDSNWGGTAAHYVNHDKNHLLGFLRPRKFIASVPVSTQQPSTGAKYLYLPASSSKWGIYRLGVAPVTKNIFAYLCPSCYGGLKYQVLANPQPNVVTIQTQMFGRVNIYVGAGTGAIIR